MATGRRVRLFLLCWYLAVLLLQVINGFELLLPRSLQRFQLSLRDRNRNNDHGQHGGRRSSVDGGDPNRMGNLGQYAGIVKENVLLSSVVAHYTKQQLTSSSQQFCLCPFHDDKNPSMSINDKVGLYHCFSCKASGDTIKFIQEIEGISFVEALRQISDLSGIPLPADDGNSEKSIFDREKYLQRDRIEKVMQRASEFYSQKLLNDPKAGIARSHLISRGINPATTFEFGIGYAPPFTSVNNTLFSNLMSEGFALKDLVLAGLVIDNSDAAQTSNLPRSGGNFEKNKIFDRFRDRVIIPIRRSDGKVIAFGGRILDDVTGKTSTTQSAKYINSPETMSFVKSKTVFGISHARRQIMLKKTAIVVEGYFDVIGLYNHGVQNAVATMGTSVSAEQLRLISDSCRRQNEDGVVVLLMDADPAGQDAVRRTCMQVLAKLKNDIDVRIASFTSPDGSPLPSQVKDASDLCDWVENAEREGEQFTVQDVVDGIVRRAVNWREWMLMDVINIEGMDPKSPTGQRRMLENAVKFINTLSDPPAYRLILGQYCVDKIAQDNAVLKERLEQELPSLLGIGNDASNDNPIVSSRTTDPSIVASTFGKPQNVGSMQPVTNKNYMSSSSSLPVYPKPTAPSNQNSNPTVKPLNRIDGNTDSSIPNYNIESMDDDGENVDVEELFAKGFDLHYSEVVYKKRNRKLDEFDDDQDLSLIKKPVERKWRGEEELLITNDSIDVAAALSHISAKRIADSENLLLVIFMRYPHLRDNIKQVVYSSIDILDDLKWSDSRKGEVWSALVQTQTEGSEKLKIESGSVLDKFFQSNQDLMTKEFSDVEMVLSGIERTFKQFQSKKIRVDFANRVNRHVNATSKDVPDKINSYISKIHGRNDSLRLGGETKDDLIEYEQNIYNFTYALSHLDARLWRRYDEVQRLETEKTFDTSKFENFDASKFDNVEAEDSSSMYDLEEVIAEAFLTMNSDPDEYTDKSYTVTPITSSAATDGVQVNARYEFDSWLQESSVLSPEQAKAEDEKIAAIQRQAAKEIGSGDKIEGVTMGINDIYEDSYNGHGQGQGMGSRRWKEGKQPKPPKEDENEWFGTYYHKYRSKDKGNDNGANDNDKDNKVKSGKISDDKDVNSGENGENMGIRSRSQEEDMLGGWVEVGEPELVSWDDEEPTTQLST